MELATLRAKPGMKAKVAPSVPFTSLGTWSNPLGALILFTYHPFGSPCEVVGGGGKNMSFLNVCVFPPDLSKVWGFFEVLLCLFPSQGEYLRSFFTVQGFRVQLLPNGWISIPIFPAILPRFSRRANGFFKLSPLATGDSPADGGPEPHPRRRHPQRAVPPPCALHTAGFVPGRRPPGHPLQPQPGPAGVRAPPPPRRWRSYGHPRWRTLAALPLTAGTVGLCRPLQLFTEGLLFGSKTSRAVDGLPYFANPFPAHCKQFGWRLALSAKSCPSRNTHSLVCFPFLCRRSTPSQWHRRACAGEAPTYLCQPQWAV